MSIISSPKTNFHASSVSSPSRDGEHARNSVDLGNLDSLSGSTALTTGNPGFGSRSASRFSLGEFLG